MLTGLFTVQFRYRAETKPAAASVQSNRVSFYFFYFFFLNQCQVKIKWNNKEDTFVSVFSRDNTVIHGSEGYLHVCFHVLLEDHHQSEVMAPPVKDSSCRERPTLKYVVKNQDIR